MYMYIWRRPVCFGQKKMPSNTSTAGSVTGGGALGVPVLGVGGAPGRDPLNPSMSTSPRLPGGKLFQSNKCMRPIQGRCVLFAVVSLGKRLDDEWLGNEPVSSTSPSMAILRRWAASRPARCLPTCADLGPSFGGFLGQREIGPCDPRLDHG